MTEQVDIVRWPGLVPDGFHHHDTRVHPAGQSQCGVIVDLHPGAAVTHVCPAVPGVEPVVVGEQDDEGHGAGAREFGHLSQQHAGQPARPLAPADAQVDDSESPHDEVARPDDPEFHPQLGGHPSVAARGDITEMRWQLEVAAARIRGKACLQEGLQLPAEVLADLSLRDAEYRDRLALALFSSHVLDFNPMRQARPHRGMTRPRDGGWAECASWPAEAGPPLDPWKPEPPQLFEPRQAKARHYRAGGT